MFNRLVKKLKEISKLLYQKSIYFLKIAFKVIGYIFLGIGSAILKKDKKFYLITDTIENLLSSVEIYVKVVEVRDYPLYVRFSIEITSSNQNKISLEYFTRELVAQLGCNFTDVDLDYVESKGDNYRYNLDITKTALSNLEKGTPQHTTEIFEKENTDWLIKRAIELSTKETISPELLEDKLHITKVRAELLYEQLVKAGALVDKPRKRVIN